jgi:putative transposase
MADFSFLSICKYSIHDRDLKFCNSFCRIIKSRGVEPLKFPPRSLNLRVFSERWVLSVESEGIFRQIFFGDKSLLQVLKEFTINYYQERNHQGKENQLLFPAQNDDPENRDGEIEYRSRLGGVLKCYYRKAA